MLLDVPAEVGLRRRMTDGAANHFDNETLAFHERVNECFRQLAREDPKHWRVIDGARGLPRSPDGRHRLLERDLRIATPQEERC